MIRANIAAQVFALIICLLGFVAGPADARTLKFDDRERFGRVITYLDPILDIRTEGWDTYAPRTVFSDGTTVNGITYKVTEGDAVVVNTGQSLSPPNNLFTTAGGSTFSPLRDRFIFTFAEPIYAFGINVVSTFANADRDFFLRTDRGRRVFSGYDPLVPGVNVHFMGLISSRPFQRVVIGARVNALYGLDDMTYASVAPIPAPAGVFGLAGALGLLAMFGRRRQRAEG